MGASEPGDVCGCVVSVASDCARIRAALPGLLGALQMEGRACIGPGDGGPGQRRWVIGTSLCDGASVRVEIRACGGQAIVVATAVREGPLWTDERRLLVGPRVGDGTIEEVLGQRVNEVLRFLESADDPSWGPGREPDDASDCWAPVEAVQP